MVEIGRSKEIIDQLEVFMGTQLGMLKSVDESWQACDFLPDMSKDNWVDGVKDLRLQSAGLSDDALVVLAGNMVTEEALPSYQTWINRNEGISDETGASDSSWGQWSRGWTAEEKRHGELLSHYLYLTGRVDMRSVEVTIQHLIRNGFDVKSDRDPYRSMVYVSFQERATKVSHANMGRLAERCGDSRLAKICSMIASDEARHEEVYKRVFEKVIQLDPSEAVIAFAFMMKQKVVMPARLMSDGSERDLFTNFAIVAQRSKVYTTTDYAGIVSHLLEFWKIGSLTGLSAEATEAQEFLCGLPERFLSKAEKTERIISKIPKEPFRWIFERSA